MPGLNDLKSFDIDSSTVSLWVFKSSSKDGVPVFTGHWIGLTDDLDTAIKAAIHNSVNSITETLDYDILAQNNEGSALTISLDETYAHLIVEQAQNDTSGKKVSKIKQIENIAFYAVKLINPHGTMFAVRKADSSWKSRIARSFVKVVYKDDELDLDQTPSFYISASFDFYMLDTEIFIYSKKAFESVLSYRAGHVEAFGTLQSETEFATLFADMDPIVDYVGSNKIQLRRALAIQQKGHYKDATFMNNLRTHCKAMNLDIAFDAQGQIIPTAESCRHIFQALLDHRLDSRLSNKMYDVPNTELVS